MDLTKDETQRRYLMSVIEGLEAFAKTVAVFVVDLKQNLDLLKHLLSQIDEFSYHIVPHLSLYALADDGLDAEIVFKRNALQTRLRVQVAAVKREFQKLEDIYKSGDPHDNFDWLAAKNLEKPVLQFLQDTHDILQIYRMFMVVLGVCTLPHSYSLPIMGECDKAVKYYDRVTAVTGRTEVLLNQKCLYDFLANGM